jgi:hypothetical protein
VFVAGWRRPGYLVGGALLVGAGYAWLGHERPNGRDAANSSDPDPGVEDELGIPAPVLVEQVSVG